MGSVSLFIFFVTLLVLGRQVRRLFFLHNVSKVHVNTTLLTCEVVTLIQTNVETAGSSQQQDHVSGVCLDRDRRKEVSHVFHKSQTL